MMAKQTPAPELPAPPVSFVIPVYNNEANLRHCIESLRGQDFGDFEVVIVDDASTDASMSIAARLVAADKRIRYMRNEGHRGTYETYSEAISQSRGELIWLMTPDQSLTRSNILSDFLKVFQHFPNLNMAFCRSRQASPHSQKTLLPYETVGNPMMMPMLPKADDGLLPAPDDKSCCIHGRDFFKRLIAGNCVALGAAIARRRCFDIEIPLLLPLKESAAWFNWMIFSLTGDICFIPDAAVESQASLVQSPSRIIEGAKASPAQENAIRCLETVERYIQEEQLPASLKLMTQLARSRYKKANHLPLSMGERTLYSLSRVVGSGASVE
jgi:hypothetical protein